MASISGASSSSGGFYSNDGSVRMVGVAGILRKEQEMWENTDKSLHEAFQDLNALMVRTLLYVIFFFYFGILIINLSCLVMSLVYLHDDLKIC